MAFDNNGVVILAGDIDLTRTDDLSDTIEEQIASGSITALTLDMTKLTFMDSTGISLLLKARQLADDKRVALTLRNPPHQTRRLLDLVGVTDLFTVDPP
jgi:anti-sigma B factor antagonist